MKSRRGVGEKIFLGANGHVVKKQGGKEVIHGGFNEQAVHHVLASRFRWRHACAEALAFGKDDVKEADVSISLRAHNTFAVVARAALSLGNMRKRPVESEGHKEKATPEALHENAAQTASSIYHLPSTIYQQQHPAREKVLTRIPSTSSGARGGASPVPLPPRAGARSPMPPVLKGASDTARSPKDAPPSPLEWRRRMGETWTPPAFTGRVSALIAWEEAARARSLPETVKHQ